MTECLLSGGLAVYSNLERYTGKWRDCKRLSQRYRRVLRWYVVSIFYRHAAVCQIAESFIGIAVGGLERLGFLGIQAECLAFILLGSGGQTIPSVITELIILASRAS